MVSKNKLINDGIEARKYNLCYSWFCLIMLVMTFISCTWSRKIISPMWGFKMPGLSDDPKYKIDKDILDL